MRLHLHMKDIKNLFRIHKSIALYIFIFLAVQLIISYVFLRGIFLLEIKEELTTLSGRIQRDIQFKNGKWDVTLYNSDPITPHPSGSSGFTDPLYIITTDGFVIERNRPINGILDSSDFKHLMIFQKVQTFTTITNEKWRILSKPVIRNGKTYGVIMVAHYTPEENSLDTIDKTLQENLEIIDKKISLKNNTINAQDVDVRNVHYDVAFEIVNSFNKVVLNNGRMPSFIDVSYVEKEIKSNHTRIVKDTTTNEEFYIFTSVLSDKQNNPLGIITLGKSINPLKTLLRDYILLSIFFGGLLLLPLSIASTYFINAEKKNAIDEYEKSLIQKSLPAMLHFSPKEEHLQVNDMLIEIPYHSNQHYLCEKLFSNPQKLWTQEELMEGLGKSEEEHSRKLYDASLALNKKVQFKLIDYRDKTYRINPVLLPIIK